MIHDVTVVVVCLCLLPVAWEGTQEARCCLKEGWSSSTFGGWRSSNWRQEGPACDKSPDWRTAGKGKGEAAAGSKKEGDGGKEALRRRHSWRESKPTSSASSHGGRSGSEECGRSNFCVKCGASKRSREEANLCRVWSKRATPGEGQQPPFEAVPGEAASLEAVAEVPRKPHQCTNEDQEMMTSCRS